MKEQISIAYIMTQNRCRIPEWEKEEPFRGPSITKLQIAIEQNNVEVIKYLLTKNVDINFSGGAQGDTAIISALQVSNPNIEIIKLLINYGPI